MFSRSNYTVGTRNHSLVFWIFCAFASFLVNGYLLPSQSYASTLTCVPTANLTNCEDQSTTSSVSSETTDTPLVLPDISPESDDLRETPAPEGNLAVNTLDLDDGAISSSGESATSDARNLDVVQDDDDQVSSAEEDNNDVEDGDVDDEGEEGAESSRSNIGNNENSAPSLLPFP
jgi:hypothetical protein